MSASNIITRTACALILSLLWPALVAQTAQDVQTKVAALEQQAQQYLQEQKPQLAIPVLRDIVTLDPKNLNAQGNLGVLLYFQGDFAEAIGHMRAALEMQPGLWRIEALLGIAEKRTGESQEAAQHLERAFSNLDEKTIQIQVGLELIELHAASAHFDKALSVAVKLQELAPENPQILFVTHQLARQIMSQSLLTMMVAAPDSAEMHMIMAGELARQGDPTNAIVQYREAIRLNPALPGAHFELGEQLRTSSDPDLRAQAEDQYRAAIKVNPYDAKSWSRLGEIAAGKSEFKTAGEYYRKALSLQPNDGEAKTGLAIVLISLDQRDEAISLLESAVKDDPTNSAAHFRLSGLYRRAGRPEDAKRELDEFQRYKEMKEKLEKVFKQLAGAVQQ